MQALYADMGHFGRFPIRLAWSALVMPGLALNYLGQGALLMHDPSSGHSARLLAAHGKALLHNLKHNHVLHEHNIILTVRFHERPSIAPEEQVVLQPLAPGFWRVTVHYGFKDTPNIPEALSRCHAPDLLIEANATSYFLSREIVIPTPGSGMAHWREALFATMARNAGSVADYFRMPDNAVIELGTRVQI